MQFGVEVLNCVSLKIVAIVGSMPTVPCFRGVSLLSRVGLFLVMTSGIILFFQVSPNFTEMLTQPSSSVLYVNLKL